MALLPSSQPAPARVSGMKPGVVIVGAGGHGREVLQVVRDAGREFVGFIDDTEPDKRLLDRIGGTWLGPSEELGNLGAVEYVVGIGTGRVRRIIDDKATAAGLTSAVLIHPLASVGPDVEVAPGCVVFAYATVTTNIRLGRHTHVGRGCAVGHDSTLGDYVSTYPLSAVSGNVVLGEEVIVGTTASVKQGLTVGARTTIGSGAAVVTDLPPDATAVGVPARPRRT